jgi:cytoskeletal protein CcmA (bactofilin family)
VETHLQSCPACYSLVEGLRAENRFLAEVLQETPEETAAVPAPAVAAGPMDILWTGLAVLGAAAGLRVALGWLAALEGPMGVTWLNPFSVTVQWNLFFSSLFYFIQEGAVMLLSNIVAVSVTLLTLLFGAAGLFLLRRRPSAVAVLATLAFALALAQPVGAVETRGGESVSIGSEETLDDTLVVHAETVNIDGIITGDLVAHSRSVRVNGTIKGDVICFAQTLELDGTVEGNVYTFAQWLTVRGKIVRTAFAFVQKFHLDSHGGVEGDVFAFTADADFDGTVGRDVYASAGMTDLRGSIGRNLAVRTGRLTLLPSARVGGNLTARVKREKNVRIDPAATVAGKTEIRLPELHPSRFLQPKFYFLQAVWLAAAFLTGLLLNWLFPALFTTRLETTGALLRTLLWGFLALVVMPVAAIVAAVTLVGLPVGLAALVLWLAGLYLSGIFVAVLVGRALMQAPAEAKQAFALPLLVGLLILAVVTKIPYVGFLLTFLVILLGLGIGVSQIRRAWRPATAA